MRSDDEVGADTSFTEIPSGRKVCSRIRFRNKDVVISASVTGYRGVFLQNPEGGDLIGSQTGIKVSVAWKWRDIPFRGSIRLDSGSARLFEVFVEGGVERVPWNPFVGKSFFYRDDDEVSSFSLARLAPMLLQFGDELWPAAEACRRWDTPDEVLLPGIVWQNAGIHPPAFDPALECEVSLSEGLYVLLRLEKKVKDGVFCVTGRLRAGPPSSRIEDLASGFRLMTNAKDANSEARELIEELKATALRVLREESLRLDRQINENRRQLMALQGRALRRVS